MIRLPAILRRTHHILRDPLPWVPYIIIYQLVNRFPLFTPRELPFTLFDRSTPFCPGLLSVYITYLPFYWWTGFRSENDEVFNRFFYATYFQLLVCSIVWMLFPVTMPREVFYGHTSYNWADSFWRWFDAPNNCFPSLHVANCLLFARFNWDRPLRMVHTAIAIAIIVSTVLVKQHYVVDVVGGVAVFTATAVFLRSLVLTTPGPAGASLSSIERVAQFDSVSPQD